VGPLEDAIRAYVSAHPGAADNARGDSEVVAASGPGKWPTADVEAALAVLHVPAC